MKANCKEKRTAGITAMLGIMIAGSGLILVAGGLFGWLVVLLFAVGTILIGLGAAKSALEWWDDATYNRMQGD